MSAAPTVTLILVHRFKSYNIQMPGATTARYAAKRLAEAVGLDPDDQDWALAETNTFRLISQNDIIANWDGVRVSLRLPALGE